MKHTYSTKKQALIDSVRSTPLKVGDVVQIDRKHVNEYARSSFIQDYIILELDSERIRVKDAQYINQNSEGTWVHTVHIEGQNIYRVGVDPFPLKEDRVRSINYTLESVLFNLNVLGHRTDEDWEDGLILKELCWNPVVVNKHNVPMYYQRDFVWRLENEQLLIQSIYNNISCGKILVRRRSRDELKQLKKLSYITDLGYADIVDGKQRLNAIRRFMMDDFQDMTGNFFSDLSNLSQRRFVDHQLFSYTEMPENTPDSEVLEQFQKLNFAGVPQSKDHMIYVGKLYSKFI